MTLRTNLNIDPKCRDFRNFDIEKPDIGRYKYISKTKSAALGRVGRVCRARGRGPGGEEKTSKNLRFFDF